MADIQPLDLLSADGKVLWESYLAERDDANYSDLTGWRHIWHELYGIPNLSWAATTHGHTTGVLSLYHIRSPLVGNLLVSSPFCGHGGLFADDAATESELLAAAIDAGKQLGVDFIELRLRRSLPEPWQTNGAYADYDLPLPKTADEAWESLLASNVRQNIRRARKESLVCDMTDDLDAVHNLLSESIRDLGTPWHNRQFLQLVQTHLADAAQLVAVRHGGQTVAAGLTVRGYGGTATPYIGSLKAWRRTRANYLQYWQILEAAIARGDTRFELGRSPNDSTHAAFKLKWGCQRVPLVYNYLVLKQGAVYHTVSEPGPLMRLATTTWKRLPLPLTRMVGHRFIRYVP